MSAFLRGWGSVVGSVVLGVAAACAPSSGGATMEMVLVGDVGNAIDSRTNRGSVGYVYAIGKYEVTNAQYAEFLNAKDPGGSNPYSIYDSRMSSALYAGGIDYVSVNGPGGKYVVKAGRANNPVTHVSWYDSIRFANWMHNGKGTGSTETGSYTLTGGTAVPSNAFTITRSAGATFVMPSDDEWYKAAYYKGGGTNAGYWTYATQSNTVPTSVAPPGTANSANYKDPVTGHVVDGSLTSNYGTTDLLTDVGAYVNSVSAYGTYDQSGGVFEWDEEHVDTDRRATRGGSWYGGPDYLPATDQHEDQAAGKGAGHGFRIAAVPEPVGVAGMLIGGIALLGRRRVRATV